MARQIQDVPPHLLWIGKASDVREMKEALHAGVTAVVDVACDEPAVNVPRTLVLCRFPLVDEPGNPDWMLRLALATTAQLLRQQRATMVACSLGMSRSVTVAAGALAVLSGRPPEDCLEDVKRNAQSAVSPGLWREVKAVLGAVRCTDLLDREVSMLLREQQGGKPVGRS
jgi:hypothetical protein